MKAPTVLLALLLAAPALAAPTGRDVEQAATRAAQVLGGVLRDCPTSFTRIGSPQKRCVGLSADVEQARTRLTAALPDDLYGVWRSRDGQRSVYNWVRTPGGYVYVRLQPDPEGRARTLAYLDLPPSSRPDQSSASGISAAKPPQRSAAAAPASRPTSSAAATRTQAPVPFTRTLELRTPRLNGADVRAVQNRLIALTRPSGGGQGDGWYGPVTAATVRAFQEANGLPVTGRVDRATWELLFSSSAKTFAASSVRP